MKPLKLPLVYSPHYSIPWDPKHRFPMSKYRLLYEHLTTTGLADKDNVFISSPATVAQIRLAHCPVYVDRFINGQLSHEECKRLGFSWSERLVRRALTAVGGTLLTCKLAHRYGLACHLAGGTHHAFYDHGGGFCIFNDLAIAAKYCLSSGIAKQVLIIDCDVHQGDGSAEILADDPACFTCSLHGSTNYPFEKSVSDLDVELPRGLDDQGYLRILKRTLEQLDDCVQPDLVIYDGGSDVNADDRLGHLQLSDRGIQQRDSMVLQWAAGKRLPVACMIGGGYDHDHQALARRHALLPESAASVYSQHYFPSYRQNYSSRGNANLNQQNSQQDSQA